MEVTSEAKLEVLTLPPTIVERCTAAPKVLIEMMRSEAWNRGDKVSKASSHSSAQATKHATGQAWLRRIGTCPRGILDMLNSRACRSAVMFNDKLSLQDCQKLVKSLARCAFPFQCAHGRPSMIPLVELDWNPNRFGIDSEASDFVSVYRKWHA